jgi:soluble lytic murein transglycosylase-like protein
MALQAASARADVLEIGSDGAHWIAGGTAQVAMLGDTGQAKGPVISEQSLVNPGDSVGSVPAAYAAKVDELAARYDLSPALIEAVVWQESRWHAGARSPVGARGLAQLMPGTAQDLGVNADDPMANLEGGARYLRAQLDRFGGDVEKALAAYNAGPMRVSQAGGVPNIPETREYVAAIMARLADHIRR